MAEEVSPESKLYVKEEIEKMRKEFKEDLEKAQSKATRTFTTIGMIVGLLASVGVYGIAKDYMEKRIQTTIEDKLGKQAVKEFKERMIEAEGLVADANDLVADANNSYKNIAEILAKANNDLSDLLISKLKSQQLANLNGNGYAWLGGIKFVWGYRECKGDAPEKFYFEEKFPEECVAVIPALPGRVYRHDPDSFLYQSLSNVKEHRLCFVAIGH